MARPIRCTRHAAPLLAALTAVTLACGSGDEAFPVVEGVIGRDTFIAVYVDLRDEAIRSSDLTLSEEAREEVLSRHRVDEQSLVSFVDAYGGELDYMNEVWAEIERRVEALPQVPRDRLESEL